MSKIKSCVMILFTAILVSGCSVMGGSGSVKGYVLEKFPDYRELLQADIVHSSSVEKEEQAILPVRVYMDNTGSMQAYIFDDDMNCHADPKFVRLMRAFRDMERIFYETSYYTINQNEQTGMVREWLEYDGSVYQDFEDPEFYFSWKKEDADGNLYGPLSMLYLEKGKLDPGYINIVTTDLAEQNVNNTYLAQQIHQLCSDNGCDAYMMAFRFEYHGTAEVPDPDKLNEIIPGRVDGPRPYYVIFTGPSQYMDIYIKRFIKCLEGLQLYEGKDFYLSTSKLEWDDSVMDQETIVFEEAASFDQIIEEKETGEISGLSKNIRRYEDGEDLFDKETGKGLFAFHYYKDESKSIPKEQSDWRLNFQIPLPDTGKDDLIEYSLSKAYYTPVQAEEETLPLDENTENGGQNEIASTESEQKKLKWEEIKKPTFDVEIESILEDENDKTPSSYCVRLSGKPDENLEMDCTLMMITITQTERIPYKEPSWVKEFDTGLGEDYFQRTYNLSGFYDILFGSGYFKNRNENLESEHIYAEIPVLITGLKGEKER